ncbi:MAG: S41 family peptidase [Gorillibacterium sp.]|nr:S41 family peptidase [Gorillibacterium sp.]
MRLLQRFALIVICLSAFLTYSPSVYASTSTTAGGIERIEEIIELIKDYYLNDANEDDLVNAAIRGMMGALKDPYTDYYTPTEAQDFIEQLNGVYYRVGIEYDLSGEDVLIVDVLEDSPAENAGILEGDLVTSVAGERVYSATFPAIFSQYIPSDEGGTVELGITRGTQTINVVVEFAKVEMPQVYAGMFSDKIGYLYLDGFNERAVEEFDTALLDLRQKGMQALVFDLRDNGGGEVQSALDIASRFIKEGTFVYFRDKNGVETSEAITDGTDIGVPVYILVNHYTASASEMLSGALQDYGIAKVIGTQTYGKGVMQQVASFDEGAFLKVTTHEYFTAKHHKVNNKGISPDITIEEDISQLFTAIRLAGGTNINVAIGEENYTINNIEFNGEIPVIRKDGKIYILSKLANSMLNGKLEWVGGKKPAVRIYLNGKVQSFARADKTMITLDGDSYIDIVKLKRAFPLLTWTDTAGSLTLNYKLPFSLPVAN